MLCFSALPEGCVVTEPSPCRKESFIKEMDEMNQATESFLHRRSLSQASVLPTGPLKWQSLLAIDQPLPTAQAIVHKVLSVWLLICVECRKPLLSHTKHTVRIWSDMNLGVFLQQFIWPQFFACHHMWQHRLLLGEKKQAIWLPMNIKMTWCPWTIALRKRLLGCQNLGIFELKVDTTKNTLEGHTESGRN